MIFKGRNLRKSMMFGCMLEDMQLHSTHAIHNPTVIIYDIMLAHMSCV